MSLFSTIMHKILGRPVEAPAAADAASPTALAAPTAAAADAPATSPTAAAAEPVDVEAVLTGMQAANPQKLNWQESIVDLMKLVGLDSSLANRKQLATELHYTGSQDDSATMNVWLHKQVMQKLADNGGKLPTGLK